MPRLGELDHSGREFENHQRAWFRCYDDQTIQDIIHRMFRDGETGKDWIGRALNFEAMGCAIFYLTGVWLDDQR